MQQALPILATLVERNIPATVGSTSWDFERQGAVVHLAVMQMGWGLRALQDLAAMNKTVDLQLGATDVSTGMRIPLAPLAYRESTFLINYRDALTFFYSEGRRKTASVSRCTVARWIAGAMITAHARLQLPSGVKVTAYITKEVGEDAGSVSAMTDAFIAQCSHETIRKMPLFLEAEGDTVRRCQSLLRSLVAEYQALRSAGVTRSVGGEICNLLSVLVKSNATPTEFCLASTELLLSIGACRDIQQASELLTKLGWNPGQIDVKKESRQSTPNSRYAARHRGQFFYTRFLAEECHKRGILTRYLVVSLSRSVAHTNPILALYFKPESGESARVTERS